MSPHGGLCKSSEVAMQLSCFHSKGGEDVRLQDYTMKLSLLSETILLLIPSQKLPNMKYGTFILPERKEHLSQILKCCLKAFFLSISKRHLVHSRSNIA